MKAYLTIIRDCFHEAFASRVLWIVLGLITLLLVVLAPLSIEERLATQVRGIEVFDGEGFLSQLSREGRGDSNTPGAVIWKFLNEADQKKVDDALALEENNGRAIRNAMWLVLEAVNEIEDPEAIYSNEVFGNAQLSEEAQELMDRRDADLSEEEGRRLNRFLVGAAFPRAIYLANSAETHVGYFIWGEDFDALPISKDEILETGLTGVTTFLLGTLGVMLAILITASMIPQTFDKGAIDLLLSKPLNRPLLFLAKYFGGCAFIVINAAYLVGGLCLLAGLRWDFWQPRMLLGIPIFLFLFGIYYSVSAIAGVIWRNAVVCVFLTVAFWAMCAFVGTSRGVIQELFMAPNHAARIVPLDSGPIVKSEANVIARWSEEDDSDPWPPLEDVSKTAGMVGPMSQLNGPVYDADQDRVVSLRSRAPGPGRRRSVGGNTAATIVGGTDSEWTLEDGPELKDRPSGIHRDHEGGLSIVGRRGIQRLILDSDGNESYENIGPNVAMAPPNSVSLDPATRRIAIWDSEKLSVYHIGDTDRYELFLERKIESLGMGLVSFRGDVIAIATEEGDLVTYDAGTLEETHLFELSKDSPPRYIESSSDGARTAVVYHDGRMRVANHESKSWSEPRINERKNVFAVAFSDDGNLWVNGKYRRISVYDPETMKPVKQFWPKLKTLEKVDRFAIEPLYTIFPKPGELSSVIAYLMTGEESVSGDANDLSIRRVKLNVWGTIWSNLAFLSIMLGLACLHIQRKDF
jgi:ABC-type transport system involved in multi-copper enzyme maturation permease subunit